MLKVAEISIKDSCQRSCLKHSQNLRPAREQKPRQQDYVLLPENLTTADTNDRERRRNEATSVHIQQCRYNKFAFVLSKVSKTLNDLSYVGLFSTDSSKGAKSLKFMRFSFRMLVHSQGGTLFILN